MKILDGTELDVQATVRGTRPTPYSVQAGALVIEIVGCDRKANGDFGKPRPLRITLADLTRLPDPADRRKEGLELLLW